MPCGELWRMIEDWHVEIDNDIVVIPKGFTFDFASIPRFAWFFVGSPATGKHRIPAVLHDFLYASERYIREKCDDIFYDHMKKEGVGYFKRQIIYTAVDWYGQGVWDAHDPKKVEKLRCGMV